MTQEEKELLFKDLCARLPYGVKVKTNRGSEIIEGLAPFCHNKVKIALNLDWSLSISDYTPYLRPMSSMTEEEKEEYKTISIWGEVRESKAHYTDICPTIEGYDWLNAHHFDYRNLIEKGLALQAPEGMYELKRNSL